MQQYKNFKPTAFDPKGLCSETHNIGEFLVIPCIRNRDSGTLEESNFRVAMKMLDGESDTVQIHRFNHWACGWFEIILVNPNDTDKLKIAEKIESSLENYPVLDDSDYSTLECENASELWKSMSIKERVATVR